jgi:lipopolysaccharide/colanic/teichoic acid biosynthesis glycosyltransferase
MRPDADRLIEDYLKPGSALHSEWQQRKKLTADPRLIPGIGRFLRRWSIDELPQLWSVVTGTMTLVGPRPLPDYHLNEFSPTFCALRQRVRPGVTGMWQVMVRSEGGLKEQEAFDSYYIRNWSIWLDTYILAKTVTAVLTGRGAY